MRGKVAPITAVSFATRITPAHAGKSLTVPHVRYSLTDHPRACGEKAEMLGVELGEEGSPPRMRGKD